jgi:hypothetical protein
MPYNLQMSPVQIARCNRALGSQQIVTTRITRTWQGQTLEDDAVLLDAEGIRNLVAALRANPEHHNNDIDLEDLDLTLLSVLEDPEDTNILYGICL